MVLAGELANQSGQEVIVQVGRGYDGEEVPKSIWQQAVREIHQSH